MVAELEGTALYHVLPEIQGYQFGSLEELFESKDDIIHYPDCEDISHMAHYLIEEAKSLGEVPPSTKLY